MPKNKIVIVNRVITDEIAITSKVSKAKLTSVTAIKCGIHIHGIGQASIQNSIISKSYIGVPKHKNPITRISKLLVRNSIIDNSILENMLAIGTIIDACFVNTYFFQCDLRRLSFRNCSFSGCVFYNNVYSLNTFDSTCIFSPAFAFGTLGKHMGNRAKESSSDNLTGYDEDFPWTQVDDVSGLDVANKDKIDSLCLHNISKEARSSVPSYITYKAYTPAAYLGLQEKPKQQKHQKPKKTLHAAYFVTKGV